MGGTGIEPVTPPVKECSPAELAALRASSATLRALVYMRARRLVKCRRNLASQDARRERSVSHSFGSRAPAYKPDRGGSVDLKLPALAARALIFLYHMTFRPSLGAGVAMRRAARSSPTGDRPTPTLGGRMDEFAARVCRCRPGGTEGFDPPLVATPSGASALTPWRYGKWRGPLVCDKVEPPQERAINSIAKP